MKLKYQVPPPLPPSVVASAAAVSIVISSTVLYYYIHWVDYLIQTIFNRDYNWWLIAAVILGINLMIPPKRQYGWTLWVTILAQLYVWLIL